MKEIYRPTRIDPNQALACCFSTTLAGVLTSLTTAAPSNPALPSVSAAGNDHWPMAQRVWLAPWKWGLPDFFIVAAAGQYTQPEQSWVCFMDRVPMWNLTFPLCWLGQVSSAHRWITGSTYLLQSLFGDPHGPQMSNNPDFLFYFFFFSMGIRVLLCQGTYFRLFFWLLLRGSSRAWWFFFFFSVHQGESGAFCEKEGKICFMHPIDLCHPVKEVFLTKLNSLFLDRGGRTCEKKVMGYLNHSSHTS